MPESGPGEVTRLLQAWNSGDQTALNQMVPFIYRELRSLAAAHLRRERPDHTLQPTALVNEAYLRLMGQERVAWINRAQFFGVAAQAMRRILVDHARGREAARRPGGIRVTLDEGMRSVAPIDCELLMLDSVLQELAAIDPRQA